MATRSKQPAKKTRVGYSKLFYRLCFVIGLALLVFDQRLPAIGFLLGGLVLRVETKLNTLIPERKEPLANQSASDDEFFCLNMTAPSMSADYGWDTVELSETSHQYQRSRCYGGPPNVEEVWEYAIKEKEIVFCRLIDRREDGIYGSHYEVANGQVQEDIIRRNNQSDEGRLAAELAESKAAVAWHELHGAIKYLVLSKHDPRGRWKKSLSELAESFSKLSKDAEALGATRSKYGHYELPTGASDGTRCELNDLFSPGTLLRKYGIRSHREWLERDHIVALHEKLQLPSVPGDGTRNEVQS